MQIAYIALVTLYVIVCCFLVLVVLVQQGRGADIAGAFGGGGTQTAFGARGATTLLHKLTTGAFIGFIVLSLGLTLLQARQRPSVVKGTPQKVTTTGVFPKPAAPPPAGQGAAPAAAAPAQQAPATDAGKAAPAAPGQPAPPPAKAPAGNPSK
ncbi:MAG TPA: preprotein translocase subunit SecG [Thermoanaerobaculia bacterium]|nr:preprotein translocase subunit SecG [Thermoanaerobaculia bacterium]